MPQLDTSTWFTTIISSMITLFILFQLKMSSQTFPTHPSPKLLTTSNMKTLENQKEWKYLCLFYNPTVVGLPMVVTITMFPSTYFHHQND